GRTVHRHAPGQPDDLAEGGVHRRDPLADGLIEPGLPASQGDHIHEASPGEGVPAAQLGGGRRHPLLLSFEKRHTVSILPCTHRSPDTAAKPSPRKLPATVDAKYRMSSMA